MNGYDVFDRLCKDKGVTPYHVSQVTGVSTATLSSWKKGRYVPKTDKLQKIADYFNVSVKIFFIEHNRVQTLGHSKEYYIEDETAQLAQEMFDDPDMRALFHMKRNMDANKFKAHITMMKELYKLEHPEEFPEDDWN